MKVFLGVFVVALFMGSAAVEAEPYPWHEGILNRPATVTETAVRINPPPPRVTQPPVTAPPAPQPPATAPPAPQPPETAPEQPAPAERIPAPSGPPAIIPGDCESVRRVFNYYDPSGNSAAFFVDGGIAYRETRCGSDTLNESSGDTGVVQLNPVHNRAGYFGGRYFGDGGWLMALHGLRTRQNTLSSEWANAAITLRKVCGNGPWATGGNYSCLYRSL